MNRIKTRFENFKRKKQSMIGIYTVFEYPDYDNCMKILKMLSKNNTGFIELGVPFSDSPIDGPIIQKVHQEVLDKERGNVSNLFSMVKDFRKFDNDIPIILMLCYNPIYKYGLEKFTTDALNAGIDGLLVADLSFEEEGGLNKFTNDKISLIHIITPLTTEERFKEIIKYSSGFLYFTSVTGVTGVNSPKEELIKDKIIKFRKNTDLPICVGFGIKSVKKAEKIIKFSDGIIIGSYFLKNINSSPDMVKQLNYSKNLISSLQNSIEKFIKITV